MKYKKIPASVLSGALLAAMLLSGCAQSAPEIPLPTAAAAPEETRIDTFPAAETASFDTKDGVRVHWMAADPGADGWDILVLNIAPHTITAEEARRAADTLFGDVTYYEHRESGVRPMTKDVIDEKLALWESLLAPGALEAIYGNQPELTAQTRETIERFIENTRSAYDAAPETEERVISDWSFHPWEYYAAMTDYTPSGNESIEVDTVYDSIPYTFSAANRDRADFYLNSLSAYPYTGYASPDRVEENIFLLEHSYESHPTGAQLESAKEKAQKLLDGFDLGDWTVDSCSIEEQAIDLDAPRYTIRVRAVPVCGGTAVSPQRPLLGMEGIGAGDIGWYHADASFMFGTDNILLDLRLQSPVDIQSEETAQTLSGAEAAAVLQTALAEKDLSAFFVRTGARKQDVYIYELRPYYWRVAGVSGQYQYIPCLAAMAAFDSQPPEDADALYPLLMISLLDGSAV